MILATQTLARLDRLTEADRTRDLRASVFANLDGLFAFHTSAEDAAYLVEELGGGLDTQDVLELGQYQCYARVTDVRTGERLPAFSVHLDRPPVGDGAVADRLAAASAERYGRPMLDVELDLQAAAERVRGPRPTNSASTGAADHTGPHTNAGGTPSSARAPTGGQVPRRAPTGGQRRGANRRTRGSARRVSPGETERTKPGEGAV